MYYIYLYSEDDYKRRFNQYGYWSGKSYIFQGVNFPLCDDDYDYPKKKCYKSLKRAIKGGQIACDKYGFCTGFDVEDDNQNVVYKTYKDSSDIESKESNLQASNKSIIKKRGRKMGFKIEAVATVHYTCWLSDEDSQKVMDYIKENPQEFELMTDKEKIIKAVEKLYEEDEISPYDSSDESDFSTEEFRWSEFEERTAEEILS